jgi:hypothetical protein
MSLFEEIDARHCRDQWGLERFQKLTENGTRSLLVRNAFDPETVTDSVIAPVDGTVKYTTTPVSFKLGESYRSTTIREYLSLIEARR